MRLQVIESDNFSYECNGCGRCCFNKTISINPYETLRIARALKRSTTEVLERYVEEDQSIRRRANGACIFLREGRCSVHGDRPAACRIYPLAMIESAHGHRQYYRLSGHPESEGIWGFGGAVADYVQSQGLNEFDEPYMAYRSIFTRITRIFEELGAASSMNEGIPLLDVDAAVGDSGAVSIDVTFRKHISLIENWLNAFELTSDKTS